MDKIKCPQCSKTLFFSDIERGIIEIKCNRCKKIIEVIQDQDRKIKSTRLKGGEI